MILTEKLNNDNIQDLYVLIDERKANIKYNPDFYLYYKNKSFIDKFFIRKLIRLIKYNQEYIGYIWCETYSRKSTRIKDMYIKKEYFNRLDKNTLSILKSDIIICETYENEFSLELIGVLDLDRYKITNLMKLTDGYNKNYKNVTDGVFRPYTVKKDTKLRCYIQNEVFKDDGRPSLYVADIAFDEVQDYYINELCVFILVNNKEIGYGQVVINRGTYSIVNLGILEGYRGKGYGRALVNNLIQMARSQGIQELYIRVEDTNIEAKKLYESLGFKEMGNISNWIWTCEE